ncbi:uncharacterized protein LOC110696079 [Chenopodium quinoa]|uniref:uncharacterized protein LOC110696079 n=1 Tax=Chenopodium quinoa TaxID=63459 RepID=UPI000B779504|nr:uncharacterized protein LOC110696079 [Chenopodium quinoa]
MDSHSDWVQSNDFQPNGLVLKGAASVTRPLDPGRWAIAENRTAELISRIQPSWESEKRRNAVASYVQCLIGDCLPCKVFTFGSVTLKTYLPDGDIDLTAFSEDPKLKDNWANSVLDMLRREEKNEHAEFQVKEVQYIQAEVKLIKCLVDNIVVDISFNQLGGLCTLCFLEEVDNLINREHLFKRSIILIKAWCYYESRILGAHHGLISTYALETLVLYIFHVFNSSFVGPLEVLYRFVEFFSKFDWANFCISLRGPVPICSLPSMTADPPRRDDAELLLNNMFLNACNRAYSVYAGGLDNQEQPFISKHFNVVDPLRINNNLGRSVSKGNFYRIRSAFSFGAQQLTRILECQEENIVAVVNQFFVNTWDRHGKRVRPDIPVINAFHSPLVNSNHDGNRRRHIFVDNSTANLSQYPQVDESQSSIDFLMQPSILPVNQIAEAIDVHKDLHSPGQKDYEKESRTHMSSDWDQYYTQRKNPTKKQLNERERICMANILQNKGHATPQFARTSSSPELTSLSNEAASLRKHKTTEKVNEVASSRFEYNRRMRDSGMMENPFANCYVRRPASSTKPVVSDPNQRLQEGQDFVNLMSSSGVQKHGGHAQMPVNLASHQFVSIPPPFPGTRPQIYAGTRPLNFAPLQSDWGDVLHHSDGTSVAPSYRQLIPVGLTPDEEVKGVLISGSASLEVNHLDDDHDSWTNSKADLMREGDHESKEFSVASSRLSLIPANSYKTKATSDSSWDGKPSKLNNTVRYPGTKKATSSKNPSPVVKCQWLNEEGSVDLTYDDDVDDKSASSSVTSSHMEVHQLPGYGQAHMNYPNSMFPFSSFLVRPGPQQGISHNHPVLPVAFYPAGLPVPFVTMVPVYNISAETGTSAAPASHDDTDREKSTFSLTQSSHSSDSASGLERLSHSSSIGSTKRITSREDSDECEPDIFNSDFASHWKNLQYGRFCQNLQFQHHFVHPPSVYVPPVQLQGNIPFDAPRSPYSGNSSIFSHPVPVSEAQQSGSIKPASVSRQYGGEFPKQRNGTGTYFPNPNVLRDPPQYSTPRQYQGDSKHDRNEHHGEREANWNSSSKPRFSGRAQPRYRNDKTVSKIDRSVTSYSQTDRPCDTFRKNSYQLYRFPKDPATSKSTWNGCYDTDYSVYQTCSEYHNEVSQSGDGRPPFVMLYPYPQTIAYDSQIERQFGSARREQIVGTEEVQEQLQNYEGDTGPPSPDYASPPGFPRADGL